MPFHYGSSESQNISDEDALDIHKTVQLLISANHILHYHGLVDAFGHVSVRHPFNSTIYIIAAYDPGAPALVSSRDDFIEYFTDGSRPVYDGQPRGYSERFIHGEIYARFPSVQCVVHSHSEAVIPFTAAGIPVKPVFHMAGFLGADGPPTFDLTDVYSGADKMEALSQDMLIKSSYLGEALAQRFCRDGVREACDYSVVLQHKHGFTCVGSSIQEAVYRAVYLQKNCKLLKDALDMARGDASKISYLTQEEAKGCEKMNQMTHDKAFRLWLREVQASPLYQNIEGVPQNLPVGGMQDDV